MRSIIRERLAALAGFVIAACALASLGACGGESGNSAAPFVGTWQYTSGTETLSCPMLGITQTDTLQGNVSFTAGATAPLVWANESCSYLFDVMGTVATARPGQTCNITDSTGAATLTANNITITINATTAMISGMWSVSLNLDGAIVACTNSLTGSLRKL